MMSLPVFIATEVNVEYYDGKEQRSDGKLFHVPIFTLRTLGNVYLVRAAMIIVTRHIQSYQSLPFSLWWL